MRFSTPDALIEELRTSMEQLADEDRAESQRAYMKSDLPYYGIGADDLRAIMREPLKGNRLESFEAWESAIRTLWDRATHREEWYAALAVAQYRWYRDYRLDINALPLFTYLIRKGAWWDVCDEIASRLIGPLLETHREAMTPILTQWADDDHLWIRRVAVLSQLKAKADTDRDLLSATIVPNLGDREFFMRKGIGWALREFSKTDPEWVRAFIAENEERMSGLTRREAMKHLKD